MKTKLVAYALLFIWLTVLFSCTFSAVLIDIPWARIARVGAECGALSSACICGCALVADLIEKLYIRPTVR